jgi:hypothetical protein
VSNVAFSAGLVWTVLLGMASLFGAACLLAHVACRRVDRLLADAPNYDDAAYPNGVPVLTDWAWADDALALGNGDDFRDWERELRGGVR